MKIRTEKDIEQLDQKIQDELGIELKKYQNDEVAESIVELLIFPQYVINWGIRPVLIALLLYVLGFWVVDLTNIDYVVYGIFGLVLFLINGIVGAVLFLMIKMKADFLKILQYSLDILKSCVEDMRTAGGKVSAGNKKEVLALLFKGVICIVMIPMISKAVSDRIFIIGGILKGIIRRMLFLASDRIKFDDNNLNLELQEETDPSKVLKIYQKLITSTRNGLSKIVGASLSILQFPVKALFAFVFSLLALLIYLVW